ncbi:hypothetical protein BET01_15250 [Lacrimispora algidixylanolytica]|uniref:Uncharacterized protein n=1 Tax=Lacrimispora algidixylanolytica TaxID=94868 RepID=A0A419T7F4_9FIRM|nr:hypothetical protein BET01_15250 [Lacrimispora algidixylanolytica]
MLTKLLLYVTIIKTYWSQQNNGCILWNNKDQFNYYMEKRIRKQYIFQLYYIERIGFILTLAK